MGLIVLIPKNFEAPSDADGIRAKFEEFSHTGQPALREELICVHLSLVESIVRRYAVDSHLSEDLVQVGYIGLIKAVDMFDPSRGAKFTTYATHCIQGEISHFFRDKSGAIRKPRWLQRLSSELNRAVEALSQRLLRLPTVSEIAAFLNITEDGVLEIMKAGTALSTASLDSTDETGDLRPIQEKIKSQRYLSFQLPVEDKVALHAALERLRELELRVIELFFFYDLSQTEISENTGISRKKVSRLLEGGLSKLKEILTKELW
ncbi:MAG: sigma-70 family RNA polymerase sigma factor [Armatimonadetes bacterium]|nr:sigma-70 family RNA polymerase sigma factor [Armatimonadota bacterium]